MVDEYFFKEGCFIEEWHNHADQPDMSIAKVRLEVGKTTKLHSLVNTVERYVMLEGQALVTVNHQSWPVSRSDVVVIPADAPQKIQNTGTTDLVFLAICTPRFEEQHYQELPE